MKNTLLSNKLTVLNVGLASFSDPIRSHGATSVDLEWQPPLEGDKELSWTLAQLMANPQIDQANKQAFERYSAAQPVLMGIGIAKDTLPDMDGKIILHSGPPTTWDNMCGPQQGAIIGAIIYEGWADSIDAA